MSQRPTLDELKTLWSHAYARSSFHEAEEYLEVLAKSTPGSAEHRAAVTACVVAYARPFTQSQVTPNSRLVPLAGIAAPTSLVGTHEMLVKLRHKVVGHKDGTPAPGDVSTPNVVLVSRDSAGFDLHTVRLQEMGPSLQKEIKQLCDHFVAHCEGLLQPLVAKYGGEICKNAPGVYVLRVVDSPDDWLTK